MRGSARLVSNSIAEKAGKLGGGNIKRGFS